MAKIWDANGFGMGCVYGWETDQLLPSLECPSLLIESFRTLPTHQLEWVTVGSTYGALLCLVSRKDERDTVNGGINKV